MFKTSLTTCLIQIKVQILTKKKSYFKAFVYVSYDTIRFIRYALYRMIYKHLQYADMIRNFLHMIRYVLYNTDNYDCTFSNHGQSC